MAIRVQISPWRGKGMVRISKRIAKKLDPKVVGRITHQPPGGKVYPFFAYTHERNLPNGKTGLMGPKRYLAS